MGSRANSNQEFIGIMCIKYYFPLQICWQCNNIFFSFFHFSFHHFQFLSSLSQYSSSYFLPDYPNNFFTVNLPGSSPLLYTPFSLSCWFISSLSLLYSFLNSLITSFAFSKFSFSSQVLDSAVNPFYLTRYLFFSLTHHLFKILSTSYSSSSSIITGAGCSFFCPFTCPMYLCILLVMTW